MAAALLAGRAARFSTAAQANARLNNGRAETSRQAAEQGGSSRRTTVAAGEDRSRGSCSAHLADAGVGSGVGGQEDDLIAGLDQALLDAAGQHIADTLDLVGAGDGQAQGRVGLALGHDREVVQRVQQGVHLDGVVGQVVDLRRGAAR